MLAHYYHLKKEPAGLSEATPTGLTTPKKQSTMRKTVLQFYLLLLLLVVGASKALAQSVTVTLSSPTICLGDQLSLDAAVTGGSPTQLQVDYNNDGTFETTIPNSGPNYSTSYIYPASGPYTIKVRATLSGGGNVEATANVIVYRLPIPSAVVNGSAVQCFRGNLVTLNNTSVKTDNSIYRLDILWGDGNKNVFPFPLPGLSAAHTFNSSNKYDITLRVVDSIGCFKDTTYSGLITIKDNITPSFNIFGQRGCNGSNYLFTNTTVVPPNNTPIPFGQIRQYIWDFGDGAIDVRKRPWKIPKDSLNYDTINHKYTKNGVFLPALIIEDTAGCIDSFRVNINSSQNKPGNIVVTLDAAPYLDAADTLLRDSVCFKVHGLSKLTFKQTPNEMVNPGNGELVWFFDDPPSQQQNFNTSQWTVDHTFQDALRKAPYFVRLTLWPNRPDPSCRKDTIIPIEVLGPRSRIEDPQNNIVILPTDKNQCQANANGYYNTVDFVNTSQYYKSDHVFTLWDFGDNFAPQCTSFLVPNVGYPPLGGWATAADQYNFSTGYWRQGNKVFPGRRLDCRYSADTLPLHNYRDWNVIYQWYRYGHDFMPWDFNRYTRNPADTLLPLAQGGKIWVQPWDTLFWGKPVFLNPLNGLWSLNQSMWTDPFSGQSMPWPRIDTIRSVDQNGQPNPQDLVPYNRFVLQNGAPDPMAGFYGSTKSNPNGGVYGFFESGTIVDPILDTMTLEYEDANGVFHQYNYDSLIDQSPDRKTLYRFLFDRAVQSCHNVTLLQRDSLNNVGSRRFLIDERVYGNVSTDYLFSSSVKTYTPITGGKVLSLTKTDDDVSYPLENIGFAFNYNGQVYNQIGVQSNGHIRFGNLANDSRYKVLPNTVATISAFNEDIQGKNLPTSEVRMEVIGSAPNRTCVIQWSDFARFPYQFYPNDVFNFQLRLNETGSIETVYGNSFALDNLDTVGYTISVGMTGFSTSDFNMRSGSSFGSSVPSTTGKDGISISPTNLPQPGLTYLWQQQQMTYGRSTVKEYIDSIPRGVPDQVLLNIKVWMNEAFNPLSISSINFTTTGTTRPADILKAKVLYSGDKSALRGSNAIQFGGDVLNPSGPFSVNGSLQLNRGLNNFWLVYDVLDTAKLANIVDASCTSLVIDGITYVPIVEQPIGGRGIKKNDLQFLGPDDCRDSIPVQLRLMRPDARGLGKNGVECPGENAKPDRAGIQFMLGPVIGGKLGDYPGISPDCGQSFIRFNHDSMADRLDETPCALDAFVDYTGGFTPGGLERYPFANQPDFGQFQPPNLWADPFGTSFWYQYGPGAVSGRPLFAPANPTGDITVGLIVGTGDPNNPCLSDTIWYHNFLNITDLDGRFFVDPTYDPITKAPTNGVCKLYCKSDMVNFVYIDSTQRNIRLSKIDWGDHSITVDSFYYGKPGQNDGYFVNGFRRVRYNIFYGPCGEDVIGKIIDSIVFPTGLPGANLTYEYIDNYTNRIYNATTNPFGSLTRIGPNTAGDSVQWQECGKSFWVANTDTIKHFYITVENDYAKMLLPVQHKYWSSSYEDACKKPGSTPQRISHTLESTKECRDEKADDKLLVRGVIDSVRTRNGNGEWDDIFCKNEPVYFYDSIRYWRPDCTISDPLFNPNKHPITGNPYNAPFNSYHYDTIDYWRDGSIDINDFRANGDYVEKVKYYFGDGDSAMWTKPVHKYKNAGRYQVTLLSRDKKGCWDTAQCVVYVTEPNAIPVIRPGLYNCGNPVTFYDRSNMTPIPGYPYNPFDSIRFLPAVGGSGKLVNKNYWFFGERQTDTLRADAQFVDTPVWNYRGNGSFRIKLVVESAQGCKDTGFVNLFISGPRPYLKVITDTVGCAPFTVKVINMADSFGGNDRPTKRTDILWGDKNSQQSTSLRLGDTLSFTYSDSGTFYIFARSDDNNPQSDNNGCKIVYYPDTVGGINVPIRISVRRSFPAEISLDKQVVCVDQGFLITNKSDTISYTEFKYDIVDSAGTLINTITKTNTDNKFVQTIGTPGKYEIRLEPTKVAPGLPFCRLFDTLPITVVRPYASFVIDSSAMPKFKFTNTSTSSSEYTWTATKNGNIVGQVDKVESDRDWSFDFGSDTGDVVICLEAFTPDPAKPACVDKVCDTISYRFVVEFEIYNVFTPNSDGSNDKFDIKIKGETKYDLTIYNRWGTKVFESTDASYDWDGTNKNDGTACPQGTYFYVFKYELMNGEKKTLNGTITLIKDANK